VFSGIGLRDSSVRSGTFGVQYAAKVVYAVFLSMPLLTELGWSGEV